MKPVMIIAIAVGCSVAAVLGILVSLDAYSAYEYEQERIEYQKQVEQAETQFQKEQERLEDRIKKIRSVGTSNCYELHGANSDRRASCIESVEDYIWYIETGLTLPEMYQEAQKSCRLFTWTEHFCY